MDHKAKVWSWRAQGMTSLIARFMGPTWGPCGADRTQVGPGWPHELCYLGWSRLVKCPTCSTKFWPYFSFQFVPLSDLPCPQGGWLYRDIPSTSADTTLLMKKGYVCHVHIILSSNSKATWMKWAVKPKIRELTLYFVVTNMPNVLMRIAASRLTLNTEHRGGVGHNHDLKTPNTRSKDGEILPCAQPTPLPILSWSPLLPVRHIIKTNKINIKMIMIKNNTYPRLTRFAWFGNGTPARPQ